MTNWAPTSGPEKYGISTSGPAANVPTELHSVTSPSAAASSAAQLLSLDNPLTALGLVLAVTVGLMAFSTSVRVGNSSASLKLGKA